ncbi:MAG: ParB/RepB/Spo0J family partition protein [Hyphomicrobiales bacterium]|nr:ParB/RepB/Spo0J family partition protein [Hyphomicrobiales bacterium]
MMQPQKRRLGRGLAALIGDDVIEAASPEEFRGLRHLPIELLHSNPNNPRKQFKEEELEDLSKSIREKGLLQPIVVRQRADGEYEIVAGERRWRASQRAGLHELPVLIRELSDGETLEIALIENIQRSDLNPLEEARAYGQLLEQFSYTQQQLADSVGKSRSHIANTLRLLTLPESVRSYIEDGKLTAGHARTLVATDSPADLANKIISLGLSVREAETLTRSNPAASTRKAKAAKDADTRALEKQLSDTLGLRVEIKAQGREGGTLLIKYKTFDQLDGITHRLTSKK